MIYYILREVQYMYKKCIKRCLDFLLSLCGIIVLGPVLAVLAVLVRVKLGSPVLFKQERPGKDEKIFTLCKFRTMTDERDEGGASAGRSAAYEVREIPAGHQSGRAAGAF